ncbi:hypothetical protein NAG22_29575, partial [Pseudomonas aeruginosa]|nr:hypothetical protein [Pseudomonas aeruginosa]
LCRSFSSRTQALRVAEGDGDPEVRKAVRIALGQLRVPA